MFTYRNNTIRVVLGLLLGLLLMSSLAAAAAPTSVTVTTTSGVLGGSVDLLKLCGPYTINNCDGPIVSCNVPITVSGPNKTVKTNCKAPFPVVGFQFSLTVQSTDQSYAQAGGGAALVNGTYTVSVTGNTGSLSLKVGK